MSLTLSVKVFSHAGRLSAQSTRLVFKIPKTSLVASNRPAGIEISVNIKVLLGNTALLPTRQYEGKAITSFSE